MTKDKQPKAKKAPKVGPDRGRAGRSSLSLPTTAEPAPPASFEQMVRSGLQALETMKGACKAIGGSESDNWNAILSEQAGNSIWRKGSDAFVEEQRVAVMEGLFFIRPRDELEGMLAAQLIASHNAAMECYRRAMLPEQSLVGRSENLTQANKLSRTYATLLEALNRHRGKGQQKVTVEHVHVYEGGQAVVGVVERPGAGVAAKIEDQPYARVVNSSPAVRGQDQERGAVPIAGNAERPLPDARGAVDRSTQGKSERV